MNRITHTAAICIILGILATQAILPAETIRMAWFAVPPHSFPPEQPGGKPTGPTITLFERIAARMGYEVAWIGPIPINRLGEYQKTGELSLDGTILHIKSPAIIKLVYYPSQPYFNARPSLAVRSESPLRAIRSIEDIDGFRIGFVKTLSSLYPPFLKEHSDRLTFEELSGQDWTSRNIQKLLSKRLDAVFERNQYTTPYQAMVDGVKDRIRTLPLPGDPLPHYFVFHRTSPNAALLLKKYEEATAGMTIDYDAMVREEIARQERLLQGGR